MDAIHSRCLFFFFNMPLSPNLSSSHLKLLISLFCSSAFFLPPLAPLFLCYLLLHSCFSYLWCSQLLNFAFLACFHSLAMLNASFMWNLWKTVPFPNLKPHMCHFLFFFFCLHLVALIEGEVDYLVLTFYITLLVDMMQETFFSVEQAHWASSTQTSWHRHLSLQNSGYFLYLLHYMNFKFLMFWICCQ